MFGSKWTSVVTADWIDSKKQELQKICEGSSVTLENCDRRDATESLAREGKWTDISAVCFIMCTSTAWKLDTWQLQSYYVKGKDLRRQQLVSHLKSLLCFLGFQELNRIYEYRAVGWHYFCLQVFNSVICRYIWSLKERSLLISDLSSYFAL